MSRHTTLAFVAALIAGCATVGERSTHEGDWEVLSGIAPGVSAMSPEQVRMLGRTPVRYDADAARFGEQACEDPEYEESVLDPEAFGVAYGVTPQQLGLGDGAVTRLEVRCDGGWDGPGATLLLDLPERMLTPWDGVFFEMGRP